MRIYGSGPSGAVGRARDPRGAADGGGGFKVGGAGGRPSAAGTLHGGAPVTGLDALLALQGVGEEGRRGSRLRHGHRMLDILDDLKIALLEGRLPQERLVSLADALSRRPERVDGDGEVDDILDAIELRARVELAKLGGIAA